MPLNSISDKAGGADQKRKRRPSPPPQERVDRLPPHSQEAEQGVLGCVLLSPNECLNQCIEAIGAGPDAFYDLRHQTIYTALVEMQDSREPVDIITLQQRLKDKRLLEEVGGIPYLNALQDSVPSSANLAYYLDIVQDKAKLRALIHTCTDIVGRAYDYEGEVAALLDEAERDVMRVAANRASAELPPPALVTNAMGRIEAMYLSRGKPTGLATGFPDLDALTDGLQPGDLATLAGYPSTGKTALAIDIARNVALAGHPVGVFTCEMSPEALMVRALASTARVNLRAVKRGEMYEDDFPRLSTAAARLASSNLHIVESSGWTVGMVRAKARRLAQQYGVKLLVVDYIQKLGADRRAEKRSDVVAMVSGGLKELAMELNVPVLALSQMNNEGGMFMSSEINMDADLVMKLRVDKTGEEWNSAEGVPTALDVDKQRNGPTDTVQLVFLRHYTRFETAAKVSEQDIPQSQ